MKLFREIMNMWKLNKSQGNIRKYFKMNEKENNIKLMGCC